MVARITTGASGDADHIGTLEGNTNVVGGASRPVIGAIVRRAGQS